MGEAWQLIHSAGGQLHGSWQSASGPLARFARCCTPYPGAVAPSLKVPQKTLGPRACSAEFGESSPAPASNLGFFSKPSTAPVRRATDQGSRSLPRRPDFSHLPRILPPIHPICTVLCVPRSNLFRCQSHWDASLFDDSLLSVFLDLRHVAPLFILIQRSLRPPQLSSTTFSAAVAFAFAVDTAHPPYPSTVRASCLGFTLTSTALPR